MSQGTRVLGIATVLLTGCGIHPAEREPTGGAAPCSFWPPPPATSTWTDDLTAPPTDLSFGEVAGHLASALRHAGYATVQPYPVGSQYQHGFAVTTRLERIDEDGTLAPPPERWSAIHPEASNLRWLAGAREMTLPGPGYYRVMLIAFTDLPIGATSRAPAWNEETLMEGPDAPPPLPTARRAAPQFRFGVFIYEYRARRSDNKGSFVASTRLPAVAHVRSSGLSALLTAPSRQQLWK